MTDLAMLSLDDLCDCDTVGLGCVVHPPSPSPRRTLTAEVMERVRSVVESYRSRRLDDALARGTSSCTEGSGQANISPASGVTVDMSHDTTGSAGGPVMTPVARPPARNTAPTAAR